MKNSCVQWVVKELAIALPYLFDSDLHCNLRQGWRHAFIAAGRNWTIDYNAGQACSVVIKVFTCIKTVWNRVRSMFSMVRTTITTIWRPILMNLTQCMLCVGLLFAVFSTVNRIGLVYVLESSVSVEYSWGSGCHKLSIYIDYSKF